MLANMSSRGKIFVVSVLFVLYDVQAQSSSFLSYAELFKQSQNELKGNLEIRYPSRQDGSRKQTVYPKSMPYMCANGTFAGRSSSRPTSVHKLRPGDIDVIGAMGDSLIAGNGAMEEWALGTMIEYRGISWCAGGQGTWRQYLTLPNILKEYNPKLLGYSTGTGEFLSQHSQLNVAFPVSADADSLRQAKILVKKIKSDPRIDFKRDWKMVTVFFGANDLCSAQCFNKERASAYQHARKLMVALDYLQANLPRTFVNLIPVIDATVSLRVKRTLMCRFLHGLFCSCFHRGKTEIEEMDHVAGLARAYQEAEEQLIKSGRYDTKEDFTVVLQPFMELFNMPKDPKRRYDEVIDISYITYDCFHFSQRGHALAANMLWNNLLEPVGAKRKKRLNYILEDFHCPSEKAPYFFTRRNSEEFFRNGKQED